MKLPAARVLTLPLFAAALLLAACGQKGALTLPDTGGATPIVIREAPAPTPPPAATPTAAPVNPPQR
jgi:predicted small lipoprotein YifL